MKFLLSVMASLSVCVATAQPGLADDGLNAYKLADHELTVPYGATVTMWDCWSSGATPRFYAWNGRRWVLWAVASISTDRTKCSGAADKKAVFTYQVSLRGKPSGKGFNLLKVKEDCSSCEEAPWTLPITTP